MTVPASVPVQTVRVRQFDFAAGRTSPVKLAYRTLGVARRGADGRIDNAVVLLHGTGGSGAAFLGPDAPRLFGPGAPLDLRTTFVVLPDTIGMGGRRSRATVSASASRTTTMPTSSMASGRRWPS